MSSFPFGRSDKMKANHSVSQIGRKFLVLLSMAGLIAGCGKAKQPWEKIYPAKGIVNYKGEPIAGALITLIPQEADYPETVRPTATSKEDGTFELGAPAGEYKAIVLRYPVVGPKESPSPGPNDLPKKYAKAETTDLTFSIDAGNTEIPPFELQ
jgi:hypothetical protein